jgi:hypothetical protein
MEDCVERGKKSVIFLDTHIAIWLYQKSLQLISTEAK